MSFTATDASCRASVCLASLRYTAARLDLARASSSPPTETASEYACRAMKFFVGGQRYRTSKSHALLMDEGSDDCVVEMHRASDSGKTQEQSGWRRRLSSWWHKKIAVLPSEDFIYIAGIVS